MKNVKKEEPTVKLKTLTPIWTGNAFRECNEIKESSIIGSIRWWYEIVNRGLGRRVCNPTLNNNNSRCKLNGEKFTNYLLKGKTVDEALDEQNICSVCKLFGCNGWSGKLRLVIEDEKGIKVKEKIIIEGRKYNNVKRKVEGKIFNEDNLLKLYFYSIKRVTDEEWKLLDFTLNLIAKWGALGARTAQGNGVVKIIEDDLPSSEIKWNTILNLKSNKNLDYSKGPNLNKFFFSKFELKFDKDILSLINKNVFWTNKKTDTSNLKQWKPLIDNYHFLPIAFHIRDTIRRMEKDGDKRHGLFGQRGRGSHIFVSHGYEAVDRTVKFRVWGYDDNLEQIKNLFTDDEFKQFNINLAKNLFISNVTNKVCCELKYSKSGEEILSIDLTKKVCSDCNMK